MTALVLRGDARHLPLPDASVDLIITSPPYFGMRSYVDGDEHYSGQIGDESTPREYIGNLLDCTREWVRVLKPEGSLWINLGDAYYSGKGAPTQPDVKSVARRPGVRALDRSGLGFPRKSLLGLPWRYAIACIDELKLTLRAEVIWDKPNALPEGVTDRVRRSHEHWFHLTRQARYFAAIDDIREPGSGYMRRPGATRETPPGQRRRAMADTVNPLGALPGSVWKVATQPFKAPDELGVNHYAAFPMEWPRRIIRGWSPAGGLVVDPFGGTGTTALVAAALGRRGVTVDRSADYCRIAAWRTTDRGERARALGLPKPPPQVAGQADLFGEVVA
ncbi:DNA-methyltransferase [Streptosporangium sp. CA-115845]|uniref:DNA-methyltransferase n=1 Tax=Streptosporangium sp. CA-115845 TaxID=3240071 RepID=UPI003D8A9DA6